MVKTRSKTNHTIPEIFKHYEFEYDTCFTQFLKVSNQFWVIISTLKMSRFCGVCVIKFEIFHIDV